MRQFEFWIPCSLVRGVKKSVSSIAKCAFRCEERRKVMSRGQDATELYPESVGVKVARTLVMRGQMFYCFGRPVNHSEWGASAFGAPCMFRMLMFAQEEGTVGARIAYVVEAEKYIEFLVL